MSSVIIFAALIVCGIANLFSGNVVIAFIAFVFAVSVPSK